MGRGASEPAGVAAGGHWGAKPALSRPGERRGCGAGLGGANVGAWPRETRAGQCPRRASDARGECGAARRPARTQSSPRPDVPAARIARDPAGVGTARAAPRTRPAAAAASSSPPPGPFNPMSRAPLPSAAH